MVKDSAWRLITQLILSIGNLLISILVSRVLGPELRGVYVLLTLIANTAVVFSNLGVGQGVMYYLSSKKYSASEIWTFSTLFSIIGGGIVYFLTLIVALSISSLLGLNNYLSLLAPVLLVIPFQFQRIMLGNYFLARQLLKFYNLFDVIIVYGQLAILVFTLILFKDKLLAFVIAWCINIVGVVFVFTWMSWNVAFVGRLRLILILRDLLNYGIRAYSANLIQFLNYRLDTFLVSYYVGSYQLGLYSVGVALAEMVWQISGASGTILFAKVSASDKATANEITPRVCRVTLWVSALVATFVAGLSFWLIPMVYGDAFRLSILPLLLLLPGIVAFSIVRILYNDLAGRGRPEVGTAITGYGLFLTLVLDFILIPQLGMFGAAIASSVSYSASALVTLLVYRRITLVKIRKVLVPTQDDLFRLVRVFQLKSV